MTKTTAAKVSINVPRIFPNKHQSQQYEDCRDNIAQPDIDGTGIPNAHLCSSRIAESGIHCQKARQSPSNAWSTIVTSITLNAQNRCAIARKRGEAIQFLATKRMLDAI